MADGPVRARLQLEDGYTLEGNLVSFDDSFIIVEPLGPALRVDR